MKRLWGETGNESGVALLLTLAVMTVLLSVTLELNRKVRIDTVSAALDRDRVTMACMAESGMALAKAVLAKDRAETQVDSVQEVWADPKKVRELVAEIPFPEGTLSLEITDELGKLQANALLREFPGNRINPVQRKLWERLLDFYVSHDKSEDDRDPAMMLNCMKDWLDSRDDDAITGISGAESDYYESLDPPYRCKNGHLDSVSELFQIKGFSRDLFRQEAAQAGLLGGSGGDLFELVTVYGADPKSGSKKYRYPGKININTAKAPVLAALLPEGSEMHAEAMVAFREERDGDTFLNPVDQAGWVRKVPGLSDVTLDPALVTDRSDYFSVRCSAELNGRRLTVKAILFRYGDKEGAQQVRVLRREPVEFGPALSKEVNAAANKDLWERS